jgi:hypothetical protein
MRRAFLFAVTAPQLVLCIKPPSKPVRKSQLAAPKTKKGNAGTSEAEKDEINRIIAKYLPREDSVKSKGVGRFGDASTLLSKKDFVPFDKERRDRVVKKGGNVLKNPSVAQVMELMNLVEDLDPDMIRAIAASQATFDAEKRANELQREKKLEDLVEKAGKVPMNPLAARMMEPPVEELDEDFMRAIAESQLTSADEERIRGMEGMRKREEPLDHVFVRHLGDDTSPHRFYMRPGDRAAKANSPAVSSPGLSDYDLEAALELSKTYVHMAPESEQIMRPGYPRILNMGATCFVATAVQLLSHSRLVRNALRDVPRLGVNDDRAASAFLELMDRIWQEPTRDQVINPEELVLSLGYDPFVMQDAHEAISRIVEALGRVNPKIRRLFNVELKTETICQHCRGKRDATQLTDSIAVPVPALGEGQTSVSLEECLLAGVDSEVIEYRCGTCHHKAGATRNNLMKSTSDVLVVRLNRAIVGDDATPVKYETTLALPTGEYDLIGVGMRSGDTTYGGHYWAHFYHNTDEVWVGANDKVIEEKHRPPLNSHQVSILLYERRT